MAFKLGMTVDVCMLVSITLTLIQGHSGSAKATKISVELSQQLSTEAISIKRATGHLLRDLDFENVHIIMSCPSLFLMITAFFNIIHLIIVGIG